MAGSRVRSGVVQLGLPPPDRGITFTHHEVLRGLYNRCLQVTAGKCWRCSLITRSDLFIRLFGPSPVSRGAMQKLRCHLQFKQRVLGSAHWPADHDLGTSFAHCCLRRKDQDSSG
jgi:hypothetical protein